MSKKKQQSAHKFDFDGTRVLDITPTSRECKSMSQIINREYAEPANVGTANVGIRVYCTVQKFGLFFSVEEKMSEMFGFQVNYLYSNHHGLIHSYFFQETRY